MRPRAIADPRGSSEPLSSAHFSTYTSEITGTPVRSSTLGPDRDVDRAAGAGSPGSAPAALPRFASGCFVCCGGYGEHFEFCQHDPLNLFPKESLVTDTTIVRPLDLSSINLTAGAHKDIEDGACLLELVAWASGNPWSDRPPCTSPVIAAFGRSFWDNLDDEGRQKLAGYYPKLIGTNTGNADDDKRAWLLADWLTHVSLPAWLDAAGMTEQATQVRGLPKIESYDDWRNCRNVLAPIRDVTWAKRQAVWGEFRSRITEAVKAKLAERPDTATDIAIAIATATATDIAIAIAIATATATDIAIATATATATDTAIAIATATATDIAIATATATATDTAIAIAIADRRWRIRQAVRAAVKPVIQKALKEHSTIGPLVQSMQASGFDLLDQMCAIGR